MYENSNIHSHSLLNTRPVGDINAYGVGEFLNFDSLPPSKTCPKKGEGKEGFEPLFDMVK